MVTSQVVERESRTCSFRFSGIWTFHSEKTSGLHLFLFLQESSPSLTLTHRGWRRSPTKASASQATRQHLHLQYSIKLSWFLPPVIVTVYLMSVMQVQYSVIDQRPAVKMEQFCLANNIQLLTYGTLGEIQHFHSLNSVVMYSCFYLLHYLNTQISVQ